MVSSIHVLGSHELGGADWFFVRLVEALQRAGHPTLAVIRANSPVREVLSPRVEQVLLPLASKWDVVQQGERVATEVLGRTTVTFRGHEVSLARPWRRVCR